MCPVHHHHLAYGTRTRTSKQDAWGVCLPAWAPDTGVDVGVGMGFMERVEFGVLQGVDIGFLEVEGVNFKILGRG